MHNVTPDDGITGKYNIYEHNAGAVCGSWWWSGHLTPGIHLGPDGSPGGFGVWNFEGSDVNYVYKATGHPESYQFRAYDLNSVSFSLADIPNCPLSVQSSFKKYIETFPENSNNEVLINIWNWSRNSSLKVVDERVKNLVIHRLLPMTRFTFRLLPYLDLIMQISHRNPTLRVHSHTLFQSEG